jgi:hypothetical protein
MTSLIRTKAFWIGMMLISAGLYLTGFCLLISTTTRLVGLFLLIGITVLHLAELKSALRIGQEHDIPVLRIIIRDMLFGFTWWLPLKIGVLI